jgi:DNA-binding transcriptional ArsR family regulator
MSEPEPETAAQERAAESPPRASKAPSTSERKWGTAVIRLGFCLVPSLLLRAQRRLGLNPTRLAVLMQLCDYWWDADRKPYPSKEALAQRLGLGARQVQRHIAVLEQAGLVKRVERRGHDGRKLSNTYDLTGLVRRLQELEPEFRQVEEESRRRRAALARPGIRRRAPAPPATAAA